MKPFNYFTLLAAVFCVLICFSIVAECTTKVNLRKKKYFTDEDNQSKLAEQIAEATEPDQNEVEKQVDDPEKAKANQNNISASANSTHVKFGNAFNELLELGKNLKSKPDLKNFLEKVVKFRKALDLHNKELIKIMALNNKILNATYAKLLRLKERVQAIDESKSAKIYIPGTYEVSWYTNTITYYRDLTALLVKTTVADWWCCYEKVYTHFRPFISSYFYYSTRIINLDSYYHITVNSDPVVVFNSFWSSPVCCYYTHYYYSVPTYWVNWVSPLVVVPAVTTYRWIETRYETVTAKIETFMESKDNVKNLDESVKKLEDSIKETNKEITQKEKGLESQIDGKKDAAAAQKDDEAKNIEKVADEVLDTIKENDEEDKGSKSQDSSNSQKKNDDASLRDVLNETTDEETKEKKDDKKDQETNKKNDENTDDQQKESTEEAAKKKKKEANGDKTIPKGAEVEQLNDDSPDNTKENAGESEKKKKQDEEEGAETEDSTGKKKKKNCTEEQKKKGLCKDEEEATAESADSPKTGAGLLKSNHGRFNKKESKRKASKPQIYASGDNDLYKEIVKAQIEQERSTDKVFSSGDKLPSLFVGQQENNLDVSVFS